MATTFEFRISCATDLSGAADSAMDEAHEEVARLEGELSEFREGSPVYRLNRAAPFEKIAFVPAALGLLVESEIVRLSSGSAFDVQIKTRGERDGAIAWDEAAGLVWRTHDGAWLGFGAIGKGFALDRAAEILERRGFRDYILSAGGSSLIFSGFAGPAVPWQWAWSWKKNGRGESLGLPLVHATGAKIAVGVSVLQEQAGHILNAGTGAPRSALVTHDSAARADAYSTALFVAGWEPGFGFLRSGGATAAAVIDADEVPRWDSGFQSLFGALAGAAIALLVTFSFGATRAFADEALDLGDLGANAFTPYITERNAAWAILPVLSLFLVLSHLIKTRKKNEIKN